MTIPLRLTGDGSLADFNFQQLQRLTPDTGGVTVGIRFGVVTLTFTASAFSATATVAHGLGRLPAHIEVASWWNPSASRVGQGHVDLAGATDSAFNVLGQANGSFTGSVTTSWWAVG